MSSRSRLSLADNVFLASRLVARALVLLDAKAPPSSRPGALAALRDARQFLGAHPRVAERLGRRFEGEIDVWLDRAAERATAA